MFLVLAALASSASAAPGAAPAADVVVVWAPGTSVRPIEDAAHRRGAAVIDRSPAPPATAETAAFLQRGIDAYKGIRLGEAQGALDQARDLADRTGAVGLSRTQLSDLFFYRGLVRAAQEDENAAWDELVTAIIVQPNHEVNPSQYAPKVAELLDRVQKDTLKKHPNASLGVDAPDGCTVTVDGEVVAGAVLRPIGPHWVRVTCPDHEPWGRRVDLTSLDIPHLPADPKAFQAPNDTELLIQARAANAHAICVVEVHGKLATVRVLGVDGRERERRTVTVMKGDLTPVATVVDEMLAPPVVVRTPWYRTRWAWAIGAAIATAAIVVPITAAIAGDTGATSATVRPRFP